MLLTLTLLTAAVEAIEKYHAQDTLVVLACDAQVVRSVLAHMYSRSQKLREVLRRVKGCRFATVFVPGIENVADGPSRGEMEINQRRLELTWQKFEAWRRMQ